jgi:hypothetical protein
MAQTQEVLLRQALGCSRSQLARFALMRATIGIAPGVALGLFLVLATRELLREQLTTYLRVDAFSSSPIVIGLIALGLVVVLFVSATLPLLATIPLSMLKQVARGLGAHATASPSLRRAMSVLVVAQIAVSGVLAASVQQLQAGLARVADVKLGFKPDQLWHVRFTSNKKMSVSVLGELEDALAARGVVNAALWTETFPRASLPNVQERVRIAGHARLRLSELPTSIYYANPRFFSVFGLPTISGNLPTARAGRNTALVNEALARIWWPGTTPLGHEITVTESDAIARTYTVEGVVRSGDVSARALRIGLFEKVSVPNLYLSSEFAPAGAVQLAVTTSSIASQARLEQLVAAVLPAARASTVRSYRDVMLERGGLYRVLGTLRTLSVIGAIAIFLASAGVCLVLHESVERRKRELAVRTALGAGPIRVLLDAGRMSMVLLLVGLLVGGALSEITAKLVAQFVPWLPTISVLPRFGSAFLIGTLMISTSVFAVRRSIRSLPLAVLNAD